MHSFDCNIKRIGFACKYVEIDKKGAVASIDGYNTTGTTLAWTKRNNKSVVEQKIIDIVKTNINNTHALIKKVSTFPEQLRMLRIGSDMIPFYTYPDYTPFWKSNDMQNLLEKWFAPLGETARKNNVRLSFHPDQFVVLASDREQVVNKSIEEFEYHTDIARFMGYGKKFQDIKINVHISGKKGPNGVREAYNRLSPEARNSLTIENEEITWGLDDCLSLCDILPIVLDIHHNWIHTGEYIETSDSRIKKIIDSWRGVRPVVHYSVSREDLLTNHANDTRPDLSALLEAGYNKQKLRAHSDYYWNNAVNEWALTHYSWADLMCESKAKNLASFKLFESAKNI